jgi:hypothetical protein
LRFSKQRDLGRGDEGASLNASNLRGVGVEEGDEWCLSRIRSCLLHTDVLASYRFDSSTSLGPGLVWEDIIR